MTDLLSAYQMTLNGADVVVVAPNEDRAKSIRAMYPSLKVVVIGDIKPEKNVEIIWCDEG